MDFVVDILLAAAWILPDEASREGDRLLDGLQGSGVATVPSLFWYEARSLLIPSRRLSTWPWCDACRSSTRGSVTRAGLRSRPQP
ncbi:MAG: type II toxin-antitoxin system VapC family toxin [Phyllobacteriaceae bacterium]|nr:type II toxin-antitoxin system VapC family toxin [Phyllobacteriaceae bacterium]